MRYSIYFILLFLVSCRNNDIQLDIDFKEFENTVKKKTGDNAYLYQVSIAQSNNNGLNYIIAFNNDKSNTMTTWWYSYSSNSWVKRYETTYENDETLNGKMFFPIDKIDFMLLDSVSKDAIARLKKEKEFDNPIYIEMLSNSSKKGESYDETDITIILKQINGEKGYIFLYDQQGNFKNFID